MMMAAEREKTILPNQHPPKLQAAIFTPRNGLSCEVHMDIFSYDNELSAMLHSTLNSMNVFRRCSGTVERPDLEPQSKSEIKTGEFICSF